MKSKTLFFGIIFIATVVNVFAHDILKTLSPELLQKVQERLVSEGYLKVGVDLKYGKFSEKTEEAFEQSQSDKEMGKVPPNAPKNVEATTTQEKNVSADANDEKTEKSFLVKIFESLKSFLQKIF